MLDTEWLFAYFVLGSFVGFFAGLLGLGGGGLMVPILTTLFVLQGFPIENVLHIALATSLCVIIVSSTASLKSHHSYDAVIWPVVGKMLPGILIGTFAAAMVATYLSVQVLSLLFSAFLLLISLQLIFNFFPKGKQRTPSTSCLAAVGAIIGGVSALIAIGGGSLGMPFLTWCHIKTQKAVATAAAIGLPIAITGTLGYLVSGHNTHHLPEHTVGYIYWPAALIISCSCVLFVPFGTKLSHKLQGATIKKLFAIILMVLSGKMLHTVFTL